MADAPWRCSQCGTVNEPVANACRTCGRWPSLFDLERSAVEVDAPTYDDADEYAAESVDVEQFEPETFEPAGELELPAELERQEPDEASQPKPVWQRLASVIVPIAVVLYIIISAIVGNDGG